MQNKREQELRNKVLEATKAYYNEFLDQSKKEYKEGDRISYAGRVYDQKEVTELVNSSLDFWLTAGRYCDRFEKDFAKKIGVKYCSLVNSGELSKTPAGFPPLIEMVNAFTVLTKNFIDMQFY